MIFPNLSLFFLYCFDNYQKYKCVKRARGYGKTGYTHYRSKYRPLVVLLLLPLLLLLPSTITRRSAP